MLTQQPSSTNSFPAHLINQHISIDGQVWYEVQLEGSSARSWIRKDYIHLALAFIPSEVSEAKEVKAEASQAEEDDPDTGLCTSSVVSADRQSKELGDFTGSSIVF